MDEYFDKQPENIRAIAIALRDTLQSRMPDATCKLAWGYPSWIGNERVFSIIAHKDRCNLQLWYGASLADAYPDRIEGTGKALRHVKVYGVSDIDDELISIIDAAIKLDATAPKPVR